MKLLDHGTIHNMHVPSLVLMERAALATAEEIRKYLEKKNGSGNLKKERILTVCGSGNNGGDGIALQDFCIWRESVLRFTLQEIRIK